MAFELAKFNISQASQYKAVNHPLFDQCIVDEQTGTETYITRFKVSKHWVLSEHEVMGKPTIPGTTYLEMVRAAIGNNAKNTDIFEFKEVYLLAPLTVTADEEKEVRLFLKIVLYLGMNYLEMSSPNWVMRWP